MPTALERDGDFSQTLNALGQPVQIIDPATGRPFPGNVIPERIGSARRRRSLLALLPAAERRRRRRSTFKAPLLVATRQDSVQSRVTQAISGRNQLFGNVAYQRTTTDSTTLFGFNDASAVSGLDTTTNWSHRFSPVPLAAPALSVRSRDERRRRRSSRTAPTCPATPASPATIRIRRTGVRRRCCSRAASPAWRTRCRLQRTARPTRPAREVLWSHGRHNVTFGGDIHRQHVDIQSQQNPRGTFSVHRRGHGLRLRGLSARRAAHELDRVRQRRQVSCARLVTMPTSPTTGGSVRRSRCNAGAALGIRSADDRANSAAS